MKTCKLCGRELTHWAQKEKICQKHFLDIPTEDEHMVVINSEECYMCKQQKELTLTKE